MRINEQQISQKHLDALAFFNEKHGQKYFTMLHRGVRFRQYVGVLQIGDLTLEILPKTDQHLNNPQQWQQILLELLEACNFIKVDALSKAPLQLKTSPLLWLYLELFVQEIERLLSKGLQKTYHKETKNSNSWKGQINFAKQLQKNLTQPQKIYTAHQSFDYKHPIHQAIYQALQIVEQFWLSPNLKIKVQYLLKAFPQQEKIALSEDLFQEFYHYPKFQAYHPVLDLAKMICLQYSPDVQKGDCPVLAILFDMNQLFEHFIYNQLKKELDKTWKITAQASKRFWASRMVRPDIWLQHKDQNYILDTKWKILKQPSPSDEDLRQMYAYNHSFKANQSLLIYPNVFGLTQRNEAYAQPMFLNNKSVAHYCKVIFVDILDKKGRLNRNLAKDIIQHLALKPL